jgi:hypothetical protein
MKMKNMYEALILLESTLTRSIENYAKEVEKFYVSNMGEKPKIKIEEDGVSIKFNEIEFTVVKNCKSQVVEESKELAEFAKPEERANILKSKCRLELSSSPDVDMNYFNDFLFLIQSAESLGKIWVFNPADGEFM